MSIAITDQSQIPSLCKEDLIQLLNNAKTDALSLEEKLDVERAKQEEISALNEEKTQKGKISWVVAVIGFIIYAIPGIVYVLYKINTRKQYDEKIAAEVATLNVLSTQTKQVAETLQFLPLIPSMYRTSLALNTMLTAIYNGQADTWRECSLYCDERMHRWQLEKNSAEALECERYSAQMAQITARNTGITAVATTVSAFSDIFGSKDA